MQTEDDEGAHLLALINANWTTHAIGTAVRLGLPQRLAHAPAQADALAQAVGCHAPSLLRLLHALASLGLCVEQADGHFALTPMGRRLDPQAPDTLDGWARLRMTTAPAWAELEQTVMSGEGWRKRHLGRDDFEWLQADAAAAEGFQRAMVDVTRRVAQGVLSAVSFGDRQCALDVGGGHGMLLASILAAQPRMHGIVFDLEHARDGAARVATAAGVADRCRFVAGSFFDGVPAGADLLLLKSVLHNWDDARATLVLQRCREAMAPHARLLVIERVAPQRWSDNPEHRAVAASDLNMLVSLSGRERSEAEFGRLFDAVGLRLRDVVRAAADFHVLDVATA